MAGRMVGAWLCVKREERRVEALLFDQRLKISVAARKVASEKWPERRLIVTLDQTRCSTSKLHLLADDVSQRHTAHFYSNILSHCVQDWMLFSIRKMAGQFLLVEINQVASSVVP